MGKAACSWVWERYPNEKDLAKNAQCFQHKPVNTLYNEECLEILFEAANQCFLTLQLVPFVFLWAFW